MNLSDYIVYGDSAGKLRRAIESSRVSHAYIFEGAYNIQTRSFWTKGKGESGAEVDLTSLFQDFSE